MACGRRYRCRILNNCHERDHAEKWALNKGADGLEACKVEKNRISIDDLPTALF